MEQSENSQLEGNVPLQKNDENFSLEEWTIIEEDDNAKKLLKARTKISSPESESSENENTSDAEEAHELTKPNSEQAVTNPEKEESDGVSVISESENEERVDAAVGRITLYRSVSQGTEELELQNSNKEVTWCVCLLVACSVLTAIGISLGSYARNSLPKDIDYVSLKMENDRLMERMKEFRDVKSILEEIKSGLIVERSPGDVELPTGEEAESSNRVFHEGEKISEKEETNAQENFFSERLQIFLHTICLMLEDIGRPQELPVSRKSLCDTRTFFSDLANLRNSLDRAIGEMDETTGLTNRRFLEDIDFRIASISDSIVIDLSRALDRLSSKNEKKLEKIVEKMSEKLCVLRNTMPSDNKIRQSLEANKHLLENCEKFDGRKKDRRSSETRTKQPPASRATSQKANSKCPRPHDLRPNPDENNLEKSYNESNDDRRKDWKGNKKQNGENSNEFKATCRKNEDDTCSDESAAPARRSSTWKWSKQQKSPHPPLLVKEEEKPRDGSHEKENFGRRNKPSSRSEENIEEALSTKKNWKKNTGREDSKNRKRSSSAEDLENDDAKRNNKHRIMKVRSHLSNVNDDLEIPMEPTVRHRTKKRFDESEKKRFNGKQVGEDLGTNGQWQFARSQTRDELRKAESQDNWYFDRMRNRRSSRTNIDGSEGRR